MKRIIALICFSIGLLLCWPPGEQVKASKTDQVCMVADVGHADFIAIDQVTAPQYVTFEFMATKPPGIATAENVVQKSPDFKMFYCLNYRTCLYANVVRSQDKSVTKNKKSLGPERIRNDTSV